jgi:hypothetical protein
MVRLGIIASTAILILAAGQALAQTGAKAPGPATPSPMVIPDSVYSSANVGRFLTVCSGDQGGCADEVGNALMLKMGFDGSADICLPGADYSGPVIDYLKTHPETHAMRTEDGIYLAIRTVYACHN